MYDFREIEKEVSKRWEKDKTPEKIVKFTGKKKFYLLDGPPYVNGMPHVGHVKITTFKDVWGKFKKMQGHSVWFQPGFDCGGLPIENAVEKRLGIKSKSDIEEIGADRFIDECKKTAKGNEPVWMDFYRKTGMWKGWLKPYLTSDDSYKESGWWAIKRMHEKGLLVEGNKPGFWCPHCETILSGYETTDSYKNVEDPSLFVKFPVRGKKGEFLLVWTTTPWTLPANAAVAVHPDETYVKAKSGEETLILAEKRLVVLDDLEYDYTVTEKIKGKKLEGTKYDSPIECATQYEVAEAENSLQVLVSIPILKKRVASKVSAKNETEGKDEFGHMVDMESGTGIVHIAPGHGDVDNALGKHYRLPEPSPVDEKGMLTEKAGKFAGLFVKKADKEIVEYLGSRGLLFHIGKITHSFPLCWRCKSPLIYRMSRQWFITIGPLRKKMIKEAKAVNWMPDFAKERFVNVIEDAPDWAVTRQRYWGIPFPVWKCEKCGSIKVIGSVKEMKENALRLPKKIELTKASADKALLKCGCGGEMARVPDVMDVWFDSGIAPWASLGYPFKNEKLFGQLWKADIVDEGQDQIRGWFYSLMFCSTAVFGEAPYKAVGLDGWTLDHRGEKMSKSLGNVISVDDAHSAFGSDALRLYCCHSVAPWETQKFSVEEMGELAKSLDIFYNTCVFCSTYAGKARPSELEPEDRWIISKMNRNVKESTEDMENFRFHKACRGITDFIVNDLSRWYIKLIRDRVDVNYTGRDKKSAQYTLRLCLENSAKLLAPFCPFMTDCIYDGLSGKSVHESAWPECDDGKIDDALEEGMERVKEITEAALSARQEAGIKLRHPIRGIFVELKKGKVPSSLEKTLCGICNCKEILRKNPEKSLKKEFQSGAVYIDTEITGELKEEAFIRELIRAVQAERKKKGMTVGEKARLTLSGNEGLLGRWKEDIERGTGSSMTFGKKKGMEKVSLEGNKVEFSVGKA